MGEAKMFNRVGGREVRATKQHKDKKTRVAPYLDVDLTKKLSAIAKAVDKTPAMVALDIIDQLLNHMDWVAWYQQKHRVSKDSPYRVIATNNDGKVTYVF